MPTNACGQNQLSVIIDQHELSAVPLEARHKREEIWYKMDGINMEKN